MRLSKFYSLALSGLLFPAMTSAVPAINLSAGWNLVGNSDPTSIDVAVGLSDKATITSVWKWNKTAGRWAFFTPAMTLSDLSAYAASKGYDVLTSIDPKDGYWVNAAAPVTSITPPPAVDGVRLSDTDLVTGWTLVASADRKTPSQLNAGWAAALAASGRAVATAWAWDAATNTWKFYAPSLESQGATALSDYITKKGYQPFTAALSSTEGFWVNVANITSASTSTTSTTSTTVTQVTTTTIANTTTTTSGTASANGVTGKTLYSAYCANCHGASFANAKNASLTLSAITTGRGGMGGLKRQHQGTAGSGHCLLFDLRCNIRQHNGDDNKHDCSGRDGHNNDGFSHDNHLGGSHGPSALHRLLRQLPRISIFQCHQQQQDA